MIGAIICFGSIGILIGFIFTLFLINFDGKWKVLLEGLISIGGSGISIWGLFKLFEIQEQQEKFWATTSFIVLFIFTVIVALFLMCKVIKDKDNADILRIRDILLGQKSYIEKYYEKRKNEIDSNLPKLEEREKQIVQQEKELAAKISYVESEMNKLKQVGNRKLKFVLPVKKDIYINKEFIELLPSYISDITTCIYDIKLHTEEFIKKDMINLTDLTSYLISISTFIAQDIFGGKSNDIRVHFRYYNEITEKYDKLVAIRGVKIVTQNLTSIPYNNSMIQKSFECNRALIKSINSEFDYRSNNYTLWKDYMTYAFYNLKRNDIPYLTFGISVRNETRFKNLFYFLNYFRFEECLQDYIEEINEHFSIEKILYN